MSTATHPTTVYPTIVLGGSGYVAGEFLRLVDAHPNLAIGGVVSTSQAGEPIGKTFGHLAPILGDRAFVSMEAAVEGLGSAPHWLVLSGAPHGASAQLIDQLLNAAAAADVQITVVDASADFRFTTSEAFAEVYGHPHATPHLLPKFTCAVPEHLAEIDTPHAAHPGCFATTMLLGIVPFASAAGDFYVSAVTGSTGAGRTPRETTHHPVRQSNLFAYQVLKHRHEPEVRELIKNATGRDVSLGFVPHSGPFARGIHATIFARPKERITAAQAHEALVEFYRGSTFVKVLGEPPRVKDIVASNYAFLHATVNGDTLVICSVTDNLLKGAAGGSIQWANRLLGLPESTGLAAPAAGWL
ncbi:MAG TPA: N-acetyl-gamma-glutamyl-phosphate reductase [Gammaproteobacteria bacterium]|nr:N-acetyl-gamma-glutamyl-phosphate reductase [Gammaproteobacteria bacterium]